MKTAPGISKAVVVLAIGVSITSCGPDIDKSGRKLTTPTSGTVTISVDESLQPLMDAEVKAFEGTYTNAHINVRYVPEAEAMNDLLKDSSRLVIAARELDQEELGYFKKKGFTPRTLKFAYDAVALIVNNNSKDSTLTESQMNSIFTGKAKTWKDIGGKSGNGNLQVVFDNSNSSTLRYLRERYKTGDKLPENFFAVKTNKEVIDYVEKNPQALGVIGVSWISNHTDSATVSFMNRVKVMALSPPDTAKADEAFYQPYQAYIAQRYYPLVRTVYMINSELYNGLCTGLSAYLASDKGQMIVRLSGLLPATMPVRLVEVKKQL